MSLLLFTAKNGELGLTLSYFPSSRFCAWFFSVENAGIQAAFYQGWLPSNYSSLHINTALFDTKGLFSLCF